MKSCLLYCLLSELGCIQQHFLAHNSQLMSAIYKRNKGILYGYMIYAKK